MHRRLIAFLIASTVASPAFAATQQALDSLAGQMGVRVAILDNHPERCPGQADGCFLSELDLTMPRSIAPDLARGDFKLFFSSVNPVIEADSDAFTVRLVNGDLHVLEPRRGVRLQPGKSYAVKLWSQGHFFSEYYVIPNMFLVSGTLTPRVIAATRPATDPQSGLEILPFVAPMTDEARLATQAPDDQCGGGVFLVGEFRIGVDLSAPGDQVRAMARQPAIQPGRTSTGGDIQWRFEVGEQTGARQCHPAPPTAIADAPRRRDIVPTGRAGWFTASG